MTLGEIVAEYRIEQSVSLGAFSRKSGLSKSYLFALEKGEAPSNGKPIRPTLETAIACCRAMEMDIVTFLKKLDPELALELQPKVKVRPSKTAQEAPQSKQEATAAPTLFIPTVVPEGIPVTTESILEAFKEKRLLILKSPIPRKGDLVYMPIKEYMMPVAFTVEAAGGGLFYAYAEACGHRMFSIFDLEQTVFSTYGGAKRIVERWEWEENPLLRK